MIRIDLKVSVNKCNKKNRDFNKNYNNLHKKLMSKMGSYKIWVRVEMKLISHKFKKFSNYKTNIKSFNKN